MFHLRHLIRGNRRLAIFMVALSLALKAVVPTGYMVDVKARVLTVLVCTDAGGTDRIKQIAVSFNGPSGSSKPHSPLDSVCPYSALSMPSLHGVDALLLGLALVFILALGFAPPRALRFKTLPHLRPPLRGPPFMA